MKDTTIKQEKDGKLGIIALFLSVLLIAFYFFSSQNEEKSVVTVNESGTNSTIETDSLKRLETYGNSGANWGMSPFGSGKPLTEEEKPVFKKPNTEWKTRGFNGINYVFGEGNPKEVSMSESELSKFWENGGSLYMTQRAEKYMKDFLSNDNLTSLEEKCSESLHFPKNMDLENILYIDKKTGRKEFKIEFMMEVENAFADFDDQSASPKWRNCLSQDEFNEFYLPLRNLYLESTGNYRLKSPQPN
jgi:hypothetical protein